VRLGRDVVGSTQVALFAAVSDHHSQVGQDYCPSDEYPSRPAGNEDGANHAGGADAHGNQVLACPAGLLIA